ncbi:hypothetical protein [Mangrovibacterium lignilyticum]|uniref:hypothetical protein n=1 Tax=Mangrovibacterium lignilyticum TaxID=2668052 RepID=UPI0013D64C36|nr:hypothetical protein [Mangrovibacterium lignilyticum]
MQQEPTPIIELLALILFLGGVTYFLGILFQGYILFRNKKPAWISGIVIVLTRLLTVPSTLFILTIQHYPITPAFVSIIAILPEAVFSILILRAFGNKISQIRKPLPGNV